VPVNANDGSGELQTIISALGFPASTPSATAPATVGSAPLLSTAPLPGQGIALDLNGKLSQSIAQVTAGFEFAYSEFRAIVTANAVAENAALLVVAASPVIFDGNTTVTVEFGCPALVTGGATNQVGVSLWDSLNGAAAADQGRLFDGTIVNTVVTNYPTFLFRRVTPAAGTHTFSVRIWSVAAVNFLAIAGVGGAGVTMPGFIRIARV
jgi:hypothetical protein